MEQKKEDCLVSCVDAGLGYENRAIIEHLDFSVHRGEYICVVGENGSGKSTLIRTLLGLLKPVSGKVELAPLFTAEQSVICHSRHRHRSTFRPA